MKRVKEVSLDIVVFVAVDEGEIEIKSWIFM